MNRPDRIPPVNARRLFLLSVSFLAGCGGVLKHEVHVAPSLDRAPIRQLIVLDPVFPVKIKRVNPDDFPQMKKDRQATAAARIRDILVERLSVTLTVDSRYVPDEDTRGWAKEIGEDLAKGRVPLIVPPNPLPTEAVLLVGVNWYGWENNQFQMQFLWFKRKGFGRAKYAHICQLQALLVNPRTGEVLLDVLDQRTDEVAAADDELLDRLTREVAQSIAVAFPVPAGAKPAPLETAPMPSASPAETPAAPSSTAPIR